MRNRDYSHPALADFAPIAEALCQAVAEDGSSSPEARLRAIHELLPRAYAAALRLPSTTVLFDEVDSPTIELADTSTPSVRGARTGPLAGLSSIAAFLGLRRYYREVFDPYSEPNAPEVTG